MQSNRAAQGKEENDQQQSFFLRKRQLIVILGALVLIIAITLFLTRRPRLLATLGVMRSHVDCASDACGEYSLRLQRTINTSVDPCVDFHGYVCGGWTKLHADSVFSMTCAQVIDDVGRYSRTTSVPSQNQTPVQKAAGFYTSCLSVYSQNRNEVGEMKAILRQAGIYWPHNNPNSSDVLRAIVYMAHRWPWGSIFSVAWNESSLRIDVSDSFEQLVRMRSEMIQAKAYQAYFETLLNAYAEGTTEPALTYKQQVSIEDRIIPALMSVFNSSSTEQVTTHISDIIRVFKAISLQKWKNIIEERFSASDSNVTVLITQPSFFERFFQLTNSLNESNVHLYVGWYAVQLCSMYVSRDLIINYYGSEKTASESHSAFCFDLAEQTMGLVFSANYLDALLDQTTRNDVSQLAEAVEKALDTITSTQEWRKRLKSINAITSSAWKHIFNYLNTADLSQQTNVVSKYPDMTPSLTRNLMQIHDQTERLPKKLMNLYRLSNGTARPFEVLTGSPIFYLSPCVLHMPMYDYLMPLSMKYGGLGSFLATALSEILFSGHSEEQERTSARVRVTGPDPMTAGSDVAERVSLDALWAAFERTNNTDGLVVSGRRYSAPQLFYLMFCFVRCGEAPNKPRCNALHKRIGHFSLTFGCEA